MRRLAVLCLALVMFPMAAPAGMILLDVNMTDVGSGLYKYVFQFTADDPSSPDYDPAWKVAGADTETGVLGITGAMNQFWVFGTMATPTMSTADFIPMGGGNIDHDTHWLFYDGDILSAKAPYETATEIGGAFTLAEAARAPTLDLLQIVVAAGNTVNVDFGVSRATQSSQTMYFTGTIVGGQEYTSGGGGGGDFDANATADASNSLGTFGNNKKLTFAAGADYAMSTTVVDTTGTGGGAMLGSTASVIGGTNNSGASQDVTMAWRTRTTNEATDAEGGTPDNPPMDNYRYNDGLISDVLSLNGTDTQKYVLEMDYDPSLFVLPNTAFSEEQLAAMGLIYIVTLNPTTELWENAVLANQGTNTGTGNFQGSWAAAGNTLALGAWGIDTVNNKVWAVLDHNSQFAVIPEPATLGLLGFGGLVLLARRRRR